MNEGAKESASKAGEEFLTNSSQRLSADVQREVAQTRDAGLNEPGNTEDNDNESEEEEEEEEPRLKYQRLGSSVTEILSGNAASCLCVSDKLLAMGVHDGTVHVLDIAGNEVKRFEVHKSRVNDVSMDESGEYIASCSDDGSAAVHGLYTEESTRFKFNRPVKTVALDPRYSQRKTREFVSGGLAGQLLLSSKGWLGNRDSVLYTGEGAINTARWSGNLVAWANDKGIRVYDTTSHKIIGFIPRPASALSTDGPGCKLFWEQSHLLYIGWGDCVKVARVKVPLPTSANASQDGQLVIEINASFQVEDCLIAGIAPFGQDIALLTYVLYAESESEVASGEEDQPTAPRPELKIVDWHNTEKASDALSINGYEHYKAGDYYLEACYLASVSRHAGTVLAARGGSDFTKWWRDGDEPQYYLVSPKDIVVGRPRDSEDRIEWLIQHARFDQALQVLETDSSLNASAQQKIAQAYLEGLVKEGKFEEAAALCPRLLKTDEIAWERWVYLFAQLRQLGCLAPYLPTSEPKLRGSAYEMVLHAFLLSPVDHPHLLALLQKWPTQLYSLESLTQAVIQRIRQPGGDSEALLESAAQLYQLQARYDLTLAVLLRLKRDRVFPFLQAHHLLPMLKGAAVTQLIAIDPSRALRLLVDCYDEIPPNIIVPAIQAAMKDADARQDPADWSLWRKHLHTYLDWLFLKDSSAGASFHGLQVGLYADFEPKQLMGFLISSQSYGLEEAHQLCKSKGLVREQVFVLGRMGNVQEALHLIIQQLADIPQAIEFVQMQQDDELWDILIGLVLTKDNLTGPLLDHVGSYINPLRLVKRIPDGMVIERLRDRLVTIVAEFRSQTSLRQCCSNLLHSDCTMLAQKLYREIRSAVAPVSLYIKSTSQLGSVQWWCDGPLGGAAFAVDIADLPGPSGAKSLHLIPDSSKIWVGYADMEELDSSMSDLDGETLSRSKRRHRQKQRDKSEEPLPSLIITK